MDAAWVVLQKTGIMFLVMLAVIAWPELALWLPRQMGY